MSETGDKSRFRLLGGGLVDKTASKPAPKPASDTPAEPPPAEAPANVGPVAKPIFLGDSADAADILETALFIQPLAQLCATPQIQTPFVAAIVGPAGSGKSFALKRLAQKVEALQHAPGALTKIVVAQVDAADGAAAPVAIAGAAYAALDLAPEGADYSGLLDDFSHAGGDPLRAAKAASDRHEEIVRKLEAERAQSDEIESRRARIADALLFETPGSRVDVFARARRGAIEGRLRRFDLAGSDSTASYRELVRDVAGTGPGGRVGLAFRAITAYGSQRRLLVWAILAFVVGFAISMLDNQATQNAIRSAGAGAASDATADWVGAHTTWFARAAAILYTLGALALILNLWRALSFSSLLFRGANLLNHDLRDRRRDLEARAGRISQRVSALSADADAAAKHAEAAARRAGGKAATRAPGPDFLETTQAPATSARAFLAALSDRLARGPSDGAPDRLVFLIDNIDALPPQAAIAWIDAANGVIGPGSVAIVALDPARLIEPLGGPAEARRRFEKWMQVAVNLSGRFALDSERLVARLLATDGQPSSATVDPKISSLMNEPLASSETALLTALAPLAANSPRGAKRFLNAYRLARSSSGSRPVLALMLATAFANEDARAAMRKLLAAGGEELGDIEGPVELMQAVKSARAANGGPIRVADAMVAEAVARTYAPLV